MQTPKRLTGVVSGVAGQNIWIETGGIAYFASRAELDFSDPHIGLEVTFEPRFNPTMRDPFANQVRRAAP